MPIEGPDIFYPGKLIAITGGIGSGKSSVGQMIKKQGFVVIDTDQIAHKLSIAGSEMVKAIAEHFGSLILSSDGSLDRAKLRNIVFNNSNARRELERLSHPFIYRRMEQLIKDSEKNFVFLLIPLLFDSPPPCRIHLVVTISCPVDIRIQRILARNPNLNEKLIRQIISSQMSDEQREKLSDVVINNSENLDHTKKQIEKLIIRIRSL